MTEFNLFKMVLLRKMSQDKIPQLIKKNNDVYDLCVRFCKIKLRHFSKFLK